MPSYVVKPRRGEDLYVVWSEVVDAPTFVGTRAETERHLAAWGETGDGRRLDRADETGTSAMHKDVGEGYVQPGSWGDNGFIYLQEGFLPRDGLFEFAQRFQTAAVFRQEPDISDLLKPFD